MSSTEKGKKIFIILQADAMNDAASNSLLKILEEPLDEVHFILSTSRRDSLKQTITSRCQMIQCSPLSDDEISHALISRNNIEEHHAKFTARLAGGSYNRALQVLNDDVNKYRTDAVKFLRSVLGSSALKYFEEQEEYLTGNKRDDVENLLTMLLVFFRDALVIREKSPVIFNIDQEADLSSFVDKFGHQNLSRCLLSVERGLELLRRNVYLPLVMLSVTVHLRSILDAKKV